MKIRPLGDRVLVSRTQALEKTPGGLFIPSTAQNPPSEGVVMSVGDGTLMADGSIRPLRIKAGEKILFGQYAGTEVEVGGEKLLMMGEQDILGVVED